MATLAGQRAQFTWALNQYNLSEDPETRAKFAKRMAKYIATAPANGFTVDQVTQGQIYPASEVHQYINDTSVDDDPGISEEQAIRTVEEAVDTTDVARKGEGAGFVYAYGYRCCEDRLKVGFTEANTVQRIAAQIGTSTPDKPVLLIEIRTDQCRALERAIQATLETRGRKIAGGGTEWFKASRDEVLAIYEFITQSGVR
jgi:T5orf172 domain